MVCRYYRIATVIAYKVATGGTGPSLLVNNGNEPIDVSKVHYYNSFSLNKEIQLYLTSPGLMKEHRSPHESSTWDPHMDACHLHHQLRTLQSTSTISSGHRTPEYRHRARTSCPSTLTFAAYTWVHYYKMPLWRWGVRF
jgi:hypothetical protein